MEWVRAVYLGWFLLLSVEAAILKDSDLVYVAATHPGRYEVMQNISRLWRGKQVRALWSLPGMEAVMAARRRQDTLSDMFVASFDIGPPTPKAGDFRIVSTRLRLPPMMTWCCTAEHTLAHGSAYKYK